MNFTLALSGLRFLKRQPMQLALSLLGIALGVAAVVAVDLAQGSARRAFALSTQTLFGKATHQISAVSGYLPDSLYRTLRESGISTLSPVVELSASATDFPGRRFNILGVDPLSEARLRNISGTATAPVDRLIGEANTLLMSRRTGDALGLKPGTALHLAIGARRETVTVIGWLTDPDGALDDLLLADIATAQELAGRKTGLDRIDLVLTAAELARVKQLLPAGIQIREAGSRQDQAVRMTHAFELNLTMLSLLGLVVGGFLVFNTMTFSVVRRRTWIGVMRALGVTRREVFAGIVGEALILGIVGTLAGIVLGVWMARTLVHLVARTINDLYFSVAVSGVTVAPGDLLKGAALGMGAVLVAALLPAMEAARVPPRAALVRSELETRVAAVAPRLALSGVLVWLLAMLLLFIPAGGLGMAFAALFAVLGGAALVVPQMVRLLAGLAAPALHRTTGFLGAAAARGIDAGLSRSAVAVIALTISIATVIGVGMMVGSFRASVDRWLAVTLRADMYVSHTKLGAGGKLADDLRRRLKSVPGVDHASEGIAIKIDTRSGPLKIIAIHMAPESYSGFELVDGDPDRAWTQFSDSQGLLISEPYAYKHALKPGDPLTLPTHSGSYAFKVAAIFRDYGSEQGTIIVRRTTLDRHWPTPGVDTMGLYLAPGADPQQTLARVRAALGTNAGATVRSNRSIREASLKVFDRTFTITNVLRWLAALIAFVGTLNAIMALQLERRRELGLLRACGLTRAQGFTLISAQSALIGAIAGLLAMPLGLVMAAVLIHVINRRSFGWSMHTQIDPGILLQAFALAVLAAWLAGLWPAWRINRLSPAQALRTE